MWRWLLILALVGCSGGGGGGEPPDPIDPPAAECGVLRDTPYRGLATLHCALDQARPQCEELVKVTKDACIKRTALNYLVNGTFGFTASHIVHDISILSSEGRSLAVVFYIQNGPGQRRCRSTSDRSLDVITCPEQYRHNILYSNQYIEHYKNMVRRLVPIIEYARAHGARVWIVPMLEDNLNAQSFGQMVQLTRQVIPGIDICRNPCAGCWPGSDDHIPQGICHEEHASDPNYFNVSNSIVTNDGVTYEFPGESSSYPRKQSLHTLGSARNKAGELNNVWLLWKANFQGLTGGALPPPSGRNYVKPNESQKEILKQHLRGE